MELKKEDVQYRTSQIAMRVEQWLLLVKDMQEYLAATPNADLEALGFTPGEVAIIKSAFTDLDAVRTVYFAQYRAFAKQLFPFALSLPGN